MAKKPAPYSLISTPLVLSMATLMFLMVGLLVITQTPQPETTTQASNNQPSLLSEDESSEALENDLLLLQSDPISEELSILNSLK